MRELHAMGIARDVAAEALAEVFGDLDERTLDRHARCRRSCADRPRIANAAEHARLYQYLMRQGFAPAAIGRPRCRNAGRTEGGFDSN